MIAAGADNENQFSVAKGFEGFIMRSPAAVEGRFSPNRQASALAQRLEAMGINPYQSEKERYLVALQDGPGEIIELGRPLRGTRFFASHAIRKNRPVVDDFEDFAAQDGLKDCLYWGIGLTGAKADTADLREALKQFNDRINIEFSELRKRFAFELLLLVVHPRFDPVSGLFDLHAHFVARVSPESREAVRRRLMTKFSKIDLPDNPIRKAAATATYMLWGIPEQRHDHVAGSCPAGRLGPDTEPFPLCKVWRGICEMENIQAVATRKNGTDVGQVPKGPKSR